MVKITNKPDWGQVLLLVNTGVSDDSHFKNLESQLKKKFSGFKRVLQYKVYALYTLECQYSTEEVLFHVLKETCRSFISEGGFVYGFGIFLSGMYTEKIILDGEKEALCVNRIVEATETEKETIRSFYEKSETSYVNLMQFTKHALKVSKLKPIEDEIFGDKRALLERARIKFERDNKGTYESRIRSGKWTFLSDGSMSKTDYYTDGKGRVYSFEGVFYDYNPYYEAFEKFFFLLPIEVEKAMRKGWSITIDGTINYHGPLGETEEESEKRKKRDSTLAIMYAEREREEKSKK